MILPIVGYGNPILKQVAKDIPRDSEDVQALIAHMFKTMEHASGVGLAAPQINEGIRLFVIDSTPMVEGEDEKPIRKAFINPLLLDEFGEEWGMEEGCLSIPGIRADVYRPENIGIKYFDENWKEHHEELGGYAARIFQHEYDHLEGILFTDYLSGFKKRLIKAKLTDITKGKVDVDYRMKFLKS
jgi:peptide deformylase